MKKYILSIDAGTTGITVILYDKKAQIVDKVYSEFEQIYPKSGWVEHNPIVIWNTTLNLIKKIISTININEVSSIGITNQRETTVLWNKLTSKPIYNAIVWQCNRTSAYCKELKDSGYENIVSSKTGLLIDSYFSATKIKWILENVNNTHNMLESDELLFGTIDTWLVWMLTNGNSHITDYTNASRTLIFNIDTKKWDSELLNLFQIPEQILPKVQSSSSFFGETCKSILGTSIPICGIAGDQQSALYGQLAFDFGMSKCTYGTGCFMLTNTGPKRINSNNGLITTLTCDSWGKPNYALEGSVFIGGAIIQWLRDELNIISDASETSDIAKSVDDSGLYIVPAFTGLGAPHWDMESKGLITGISRDTNKSHFIRAALESISYQVNDLYMAIKLDMNTGFSLLKVDGGATANDFLMQFQSDILNLEINRPKNIETTSLGAALLAGLSVGFWKEPKDFQNIIETDKIFKPNIDSRKRKSLLSGWDEAIHKTISKRR